MLSALRTVYGRALAPLARFLLRLGLSPDAVTVVGTLGVSMASLMLLPNGHLMTGTAVVSVFLLGDGLDGTMARISGRQSRFGAFLDSTMDRIADAAFFGALTLWAATTAWILAAAVAALASGFLVSYTRARAEVEGWRADQGPFERTERLVLALAGTAAVGFGASEVVLGGALVLIALGSAFTAARRVASAWRAAQL